MTWLMNSRPEYTKDTDRSVWGRTAHTRVGMGREGPTGAVHSMRGCAHQSRADALQPNAEGSREAGLGATTTQTPLNPITPTRHCAHALQPSPPLRARPSAPGYTWNTVQQREPASPRDNMGPHLTPSVCSSDTCQ